MTDIISSNINHHHNYRDSAEITKVAFVTSYLPRRCGIATFSCDLIEAIKENQKDNDAGSGSNLFPVVAIDNTEPVHDYNEDVIYVVEDQNRADFARAAGIINNLSVTAVSLQHEFNLYGGKEGSFILEMLSNIQQPVVTTLHTVLPNPAEEQKRVLQEVCAYSSTVVVISEKAGVFLEEVYGVPADKIKVIHHGIKDVPFCEPCSYKSRLGLEDRPVILTFGLLDHNKGIEYVIEAMDEVTREIPHATFVVLGTTHPSVLKNHGESYLDMLKRMAREKGLANNVLFNSQFISDDLLTDYMLAADIFITPYPNKERISSGALAFAMGCGKAIVSTPYYYAEEMLKNRRGQIVPFKDSSAIAAELVSLLQDEELRNSVRENAYSFSRMMVWDKVAESYMDAFKEALSASSLR